jgi:hypothetical protein
MNVSACMFYFLLFFILFIHNAVSERLVVSK